VTLLGEIQAAAVD